MPTTNERRYGLLRYGVSQRWFAGVCKPCSRPQRCASCVCFPKDGIPICGTIGACLPVAQCLIDEAELAGLSARERELAIKRAKNREAARR